MKIGELATHTGTQVETIRFYEREGLLPAPGRSSGNYRVYEERHVQRLAFIRQCRVLDMTLDEIRRLLGFIDAPDEDCGEVNSLLDEHIGHVGHRIRELKALERELRQLRDQCGDARPAKDCGILGELTRASNRSGADRARPRGGDTHGRKPGTAAR
ncbi:Cd(II)/Pb(II)-responsive transcriptional regulator [Piscinibacter gummiphilus]|uniref:Cd(II)/Pb(II)-responsive transcriptional regulator n=1 Tax=Piscinibacter gummiphilus TaxID=946333 RepID=A0ABZ0D182_9BURK|nr:Cd(II)/Pb(II)-responsive transcriptional regulator [Piscinibacter gummiphilus]WOB10943.1 Cd(II)/Pb(II)-responsive transcriptional regulator [Piscinibacter gummiphilus]